MCTVVEVVFEAAEYSDEEGSAVEVCALMKGIAVIEVSALVSTRPSAEGALGKREKFGENVYTWSCIN